MPYSFTRVVVILSVCYLSPGYRFYVRNLSYTQWWGNKKSSQEKIKEINEKTKVSKSRDILLTFSYFCTNEEISRIDKVSITKVMLSHIKGDWWLPYKREFTLFFDNDVISYFLQKSKIEFIPKYYIILSI